MLQNPDTIQVYAKRKCSVCSGKGYIILANIGQNQEHILCDCVKKNVIKEVKKRV